MRVAERVEQEQHFTEGEPDLEPPEELAVGELDDETQLEEDLDSEAVLEQDVDEDVLEATLDDLVHLGDEDDDEGPGEGPGDGLVSEDVLEELDADALDLVDVEESLDRILRERLATPIDGGDEDEGDESTPAWALSLPAVDTLVSGCRTDEFVCRGCFLVRHRVQLADEGRLLCRDCAT